MDAIAGSATVAMNDLVARKRREGADVVAFNIGEPDFVTPSHIREAAKRALDAGHTHYTPGAGIPELREAIARTARLEQGIECTASDVVAAPAKQAIFYALMATVQPGDEVLVPDPGWVSYAPIVTWCGATAVPVPLHASNGFRMTPEAVAARITPRTRVILLNSPSNPTGGVSSQSDVDALVALAVQHDLWIVSDEIYRHLQYDGLHVSPASRPGGKERTITVDGLSKSFAMTGWRVGWSIAPAAATEAIQKLQSHSLTHITSIAQYAAVEALTGPQGFIATMKAEFLRRRDLMVTGLRDLPGVECPTPSGAFYAFARFDPALWGDDERLATRLLDEANVAVTAGSSFGVGGRNHLRLSYATSADRIAEGLRRMTALRR